MWFVDLTCELTCYVDFGQHLWLWIFTKFEHEKSPQKMWFVDLTLELTCYVDFGQHLWLWIYTKFEHERTHEDYVQVQL